MKSSASLPVMRAVQAIAMAAHIASKVKTAFRLPKILEMVPICGEHYHFALRTRIELVFPG